MSSHNSVTLPSMHKLKCKMGMFRRSKILGRTNKQLDPNVKWANSNALISQRQDLGECLFILHTSKHHRHAKLHQFKPFKNILVQNLTCLKPLPQSWCWVASIQGLHGNLTVVLHCWFQKWRLLIKDLKV
jgi:hypothetical protein